MNGKHLCIFSILIVIFISGCVNQRKQIKQEEDSKENQNCIEPTDIQILNLLNLSRSIRANHYDAFSNVVEIDDKINNLIYGAYSLDSGFLQFYILDQKNYNAWNYGKDYQFYYASPETSHSFRFVPDHSDVYYFIVHNTFRDRDELHVDETPEGSIIRNTSRWVNYNYTGDYTLNIDWKFNYKEKRCF